MRELKIGEPPSGDLSALVIVVRFFFSSSLNDVNNSYTRKLILWGANVNVFLCIFLWFRTLLSTKHKLLVVVRWLTICQEMYSRNPWQHCQKSEVKRKVPLIVFHVLFPLFFNYLGFTTLMLYYSCPYLVHMSVKCAVYRIHNAIYVFHRNSLGSSQKLYLGMRLKTNRKGMLNSSCFMSCFLFPWIIGDLQNGWPSESRWDEEPPIARTLGYKLYLKPRGRRLWQWRSGQRRRRRRRRRRWRCWWFHGL